jgi:hypothetical protein
MLLWVCFGFALICFEVALDLLWASLRLWNEKGTSSDKAGTVYSPNIYFTLIVFTSKRCCFGFAMGLLLICFEVALDLLWAYLWLQRMLLCICFRFALGLFLICLEVVLD